MKILAIQGSPRPKGNTQAVLDLVLDAAREAGASVDVVRLSKLKNISGCRECNTCKKTPDEIGCALDDDILGVLRQSLESDLVLWATPVFCWAPSWLIKMPQDRYYSLFKYKEDGTVNSLMKGRKMAAVITAGGDENDGADLVSETCRRLCAFSQCDWVGALIAAEVKNPDTIRADTKLVDRARRFGTQLVA
ncbi:MAG: flavodoxin family protein [Planctomycetota bacterium]|jgi:multimeric flavodoxin WrbA